MSTEPRSSSAGAIAARQTRLHAVLASLRPRLRAHSAHEARRATTCWRVLDLFSPDEVDPVHAPVVEALGRVPSIRAPDRFHGPDLRGLVEHLLVGVRYPLPDVLWRDLGSGRPPMELLAFLGRGGSVRDAGRAGLLPMLTPREAPRWWGSGGDRAVIAARRVQVEAVCGPDWLADTLSTTFLAELQPDEPRWRSIVAWLSSRADDIDPALVPHLLDFLRQHPDRPGARGGASVVREAIAWSAPEDVVLAKPRAQFPPSGVGGGPLGGEWSIHELRHSFELLIEGKVLHHCVATYATRAKAGQCALFGLRRAGRRQLTVEVLLPDRAIVQVRGNCNRRPNSEEREVLRRWAVERQVAVRSW